MFAVGTTIHIKENNLKEHFNLKKKFGRNRKIWEDKKALEKDGNIGY